MGNRAQVNGTIGENSSQASFDAFVAGVNAANVNVQRDGVNNSAGGRYGVNAGFQSATFLNPDMVAEMRVISLRQTPNSAAATHRFKCCTMNIDIADFRY